MTEAKKTDLLRERVGAGGEVGEGQARVSPLRAGSSARRNERAELPLDDHVCGDQRVDLRCRNARFREHFARIGAKTGRAMP